MTHMHPMETAYCNGAVRVPDDIASEICEATNCGLPTNWPEFTDRDGMDPMLRRDVEREFGPLAASRP